MYVPIRSGCPVADQPAGFDLTAVAISTIVIVAMVFLAVHLIPALATAVYQLVPMVIVVWFIVMVLRGIVKGLLP